MNKSFSSFVYVTSALDTVETEEMASFQHDTFEFVSKCQTFSLVMTLNPGHSNPKNLNHIGI